MSLRHRIIRQLQTEGPMTVAEYMTLCLLDPTEGFYPTRDPLGSEGDFITAPEISQMFGEVLGLWVIQTWKDLGQPADLHLVEFGPGRGIMMQDMLNAIRLAEDCLQALNISLIEASAALEAVQAQTLKSAPVPISWARKLSDIDAGPTIIIGNEYLDCLPIRQFIQQDPFAKEAGWHERLITYDQDNQNFRFAISPTPLPERLQTTLPSAHIEAKKGDLLEVCHASHLLLDDINERFKASPGRALFIDYGPEITEFGDTFQALKHHEKVGVFSDPGHTDLTARVDFGALCEFSTSIGLNVASPVPQNEFLSKLGIEVRAVTLARTHPQAKDKLARQLKRLTSSDQMGTLFKAICFQSNNLELPLGFRSLLS